MAAAKRNREREQAAKRQAKYQARIAAKRTRRRVVFACIAIALIASLTLGALLATRGGRRPENAGPSNNGPDNAAQATHTPSPDPLDPLVDAAPDPALAQGRTWQATFTTSVGDIVVELYGDAAPQAVASFITLAQEDFFADTFCHRLTTAGIFVLQCGDPEGTGMGGPAFRFGPVENAPEDDVYPAGTLAMARRGHDGYSMGSQFFLVYEDSFIPPDSAGGYTVFGRVISGLDYIQAVADAGVAGGATDGLPAMMVTIEGVEVQ